MYVALANLTNGGLSGGSRKYLEVLAPMLANHPAISRLDVFVPPQATEALHRATRLNCESWVHSDVSRGFRGLRAELLKRQPDVVFIPSARWIDCGPAPVVTMVRNMEPLAVPFAGNPWLEMLRTLARRWVAKRTCWKSDRVIAVSDFVNDYLVQNWRLPSDRVATVYHGIDLPTGDEDAQRPATLSELSRPFLFTAGSVRPYRGLEDAVGALPQILKHQPDLMLVIGGETEPAMEPYRNRLIRQAQNLGCADRLLWCGKLSQPEMNWCFQQCQAFVMTSRVEACPNTVLEAMAQSCISVSTNSAPMPEIYGDTAFFYTAGNSEELAARVHTALSLDVGQRYAMRSATRRRAGEFSWHRTLESTVRELLLAAGRTDIRGEKKVAA
jgi:glycosyltransferase involved in cell wall biosynthesis